MTITLDLAPDIEQGLLAQAQAKGVSITDYVEQLVERQARQGVPASALDAPAGQTLLDVCAAVRGLLTDEEEEQKAKALEAAARIRELRKGVTLDRPEGMSLREYAHIGHRY